MNLASRGLCSALSPPGVPLHRTWVRFTLLSQHVARFWGAKRPPRRLSCCAAPFPQAARPALTPSSPARALPERPGLRAGEPPASCSAARGGSRHICFLTGDAFAWKRPNPLLFNLFFFSVIFYFFFLVFNFLIFGNLCIICCVTQSADAAALMSERLGFRLSLS